MTMHGTASHLPHAVAFLLSCSDREDTRAKTLERLTRTDWGSSPRIVMDASTSGRREERQEQAAASLLSHALDEQVELILFLEDDLAFNRHLRHNLTHWAPLQRWRPGDHFFGSLYNPTIRELSRYENEAFFVADPEAVYGSQAFVLSAATARHLLDRWGDVPGMQDIKMSRLAAQVTPIHYHLPSLVQHVGISVWGGIAHTAPDFNLEWKAPDAAAAAPRRLDKEQEVLLRLPIVVAMRVIEGWLDDEEAEALIATAEAAVQNAAAGDPVRIVEVGSYCGKSTVVFGLAVRALAPDRARIYAVDPHEGALTTLEQRTVQLAPTLERFISNIDAAGVTGVVEPVVARSTDVAWHQPIDLLFIDGLHDYENVSADFRHFGRWIRRGGFAAFHDYGYHFPGVRRFVDDLRSSVEYVDVLAVHNLVVVRKATNE